MGLFERMMASIRDVDFVSGNADAAGCSGAHAGTDTADAMGETEISPHERDLARELAAAAQNGTTPVRYALLFSGDVQGVGFRWTNQGLAREHGLGGWVRNLDDGTVEMEIQGSPAAISEHLARIHAYYQRFRNRIWLEQAESIPVNEQRCSFEVRM